MVKHTQAICPLQSTNCLSVFDHFVGLALKGLTFDFTRALNNKPRTDSISFQTANQELTV